MKTRVEIFRALLRDLLRVGTQKLRYIFNAFVMLARKMEPRGFQPDWWMLDEGEARTYKCWRKMNQVRQGGSRVQAQFQQQSKTGFGKGSKTNLPGEIISKLESSPTRNKPMLPTEGAQHLVNDT